MIEHTLRARATARLAHHVYRSATGAVYRTKTSFDALSRPRTVKLPDNQTVSTLYDGLTATTTDQAGRKRQVVSGGQCPTDS